MKEWLIRYGQRLRLEGVGEVERQEGMNRVNPKYVLRNYLAQLATDKAENGDFTMVEELQKLLCRPYGERPDKEWYAGKR